VELVRAFKSYRLEFLSTILKLSPFTDREYIEIMPDLIESIWQSIVRRTEKLYEATNKLDEKEQLIEEFKTIQRRLLELINCTLPKIH
jgi:hypothetical protein